MTCMCIFELKLFLLSANGQWQNFPWKMQILQTYIFCQHTLGTRCWSSRMLALLTSLWIRGFSYAVWRYRIPRAVPRAMFRRTCHCSATPSCWIQTSETKIGLLSIYFCFQSLWIDTWIDNLYLKYKGFNSC